MSNRGIVTNLALQSNGLYLSPWTINGTSIVQTTSQADPLGGTGASLWTESTDVSGVAHFEFFTADSSLRGKTLIHSLYVKAGTRAQFGLFGTGSTQALIAYYDLITLTVTGGNGSLITQGITGGIEVCRENAAWRRIWMKYPATITGTLDTRWYIYNAGASSYQGNGSAAISVFGAQVEIAVTGQDTPSPYVASGATAGVGYRSYKQNLVLYSQDQSNAAWNALSGAIISGPIYADPFGTSTACLLTFGGGYIRQLLATTSFQNGTQYTISMWLRSNSPGTVRLNDVFVGATGATTLSVTTTWTLFKIIVSATSASFFGPYLDTGSGLTSVYISGVQIAQADHFTDYVKTTSAPYNPSGATRRLI